MFRLNSQQYDYGCGPRGGNFDRHFAGFGGVRSFGGRARSGRGFGGALRERMFDSGEFQLVLLHLLAEKPSYGYELMKTLEEKLAGGYAPSPGVIYPTLTMLEEKGLAITSAEGERKVYTVTEAGRQTLVANKTRIDEVLSRLKETGECLDRGNTPDFRIAMNGLKRALTSVAIRGRATREGMSAEKIAKVVAALENATKTIDGL